MPLPKAPPAGASAGPAAPECWLCGEAALEAESDLVEVFCNQGDCCDASGSRYHRDCMLAHIEKAGRVRKTHGGATDMRQIARMELSGAPVDPRVAIACPWRPAERACRRCAQASTACTLAVTTTRAKGG